MAQFFVKCSDKFLFKNYSANHKLLKAKPCLSQLCGGSGVYQFNWERKVFQQNGAGTPTICLEKNKPQPLLHTILKNYFEMEHSHKHKS